MVYPRIGKVSVPYSSSSNEVELEGLIATKPDIAIVSQNAAPVVDSISEAGIPVVTLYFTNFDELKKGFLLTGEILGGESEKRAEKYCDYLDSKLDEITKVTSQIDDDKKPKVLHLQSLEPMKADGADTLINTWIDVAGGTNAAANDLSGNMKGVSFEQIQQWNPDVIILGTTMQDKEKIMNDPLWKDISAVKNDRIYINPKGVFQWDRYGAEEALQIQWAAQVLHPDLFPTLDIRNELKNFYQEFFDYDLTDDEVEMILYPEK